VQLVGEADAMVAIGLVLCGPFTPMLFMGEEWAASTPFPYFCDARDEQLDEAVRQGRQHEFATFGWDPSDIPDPIAPSTYESARLRWDEVASGAREHAAMLSWYRELLALRRDRPELCDPRPSSVSVDVDETQGTLVMRRGTTVVMANLSKVPASLPAREAVLAASSNEVVVADGEISLPAHSLAVVG
jgi:maltooligosyltrehalose trehalohydrolase